MDSKKIYELQFYFKQDSIIMEYRHQYICFNSFNIRNKRSLSRLKDDIEHRKVYDLDSAFGQARIHNVPSMSLTDDSAIRANIRRVN